MTPVHWLTRSALHTPDAPAVFVGAETRLTYSQLHKRALALAAALIAEGIAPGDRVGVWLANRPEYLEIMQAIWAAGAVAVPLNHKLHPREVADIAGDCGAALTFTESILTGGPPTIDVNGEEYTAMLETAPLARTVERSGDDLAWLFYTSGTTGRAKGAMLSFANLSAMAHAYLVDVDHAARERAMLYAAPLSHGAGLYALAQFLIGGVHVLPESGGFEPAEILALAASGHLPPLSFFAAPTMVRRLVAQARAQGSRGEGIGLVVYGGGPMYAADIEEALDCMGDRFAQLYGQGETPMTITCLTRETLAERNHPEWRHRLRSVGRPHSCIALRIADAEGEPVPRGEVGEVLVRGPTVMQGYWNLPEASAAALAGGWLHTGDSGSLDAHGFLTLSDRLRDVIISGGSNIYPREVEEVLLTHERVEQVAVVGVPDAEWGEQVVAYVVGRAGNAPSPAELDRLCLDRLARFKRPKVYRFVAELPKNAYGKVLKTELRALAPD